MYSKDLKTIFRVLGNAMHELADMTEERAERLEMTAAQYLAHIAVPSAVELSKMGKTIDANDAPDVGAETPIVTTNTAAQVFGTAAAESIETATRDLTAEIAAVKAMITPPAPAASPTVIDFAALVPATPVYTMTAAAQGFTREQYHAQGWTDEALVEHGLATVERPVLDNSPNVPPAGASGTSPAISAQVPASIPDVPQAAPANTVVPAQTGGATPPVTDKTGLPWDARIHSGSRVINADGSWKKKKGTGDVFYAQVVAELRQQQPAPATPFEPLVPAAAPQVAPQPAPAPQAAPQPSPAPAPAAAPVAAPTTFSDLCKWVTSSGRTMAEMLEFAKEFGIEAAGQLAMPPNASLIPMIYEKMVAA